LVPSSLRPIENKGSIAEFKLGETIALSHHEKCDGSGYPSGLKGHEILFAGRIAAIADELDALTSKRPYFLVVEAEEKDINVGDISLYRKVS
jgi:response regulator RpfG family c-di-GMP phosphodiesterase